VPVAHAANPNYLGGGDREDYGVRPMRQKVFEIPFQLIAGHGGARLSSQLCGKHE
jgi:hypothetical protein